MNKICFLLLILSCWVHPLVSQDNTNIYMFDLEEEEGYFYLTNRRDVATHEGYDNQPSFSLDGNYLYYTSMREGQTDIFRYNLKSNTTQQITATPESEYSPTSIPNQEAISVVRVENDGTQRLWKFPLSGKTPSIILPRVKPVGYHAWASEKELGFFILGEPNTFDIAKLTFFSKWKKSKKIAPDIGRCIQKIPHQNALSFTQKIDSTTWVMRYDFKSKKIDKITALEDFSETKDYAWMPDGKTLFSSAYDDLMVWDATTAMWDWRVFFEDDYLENISRLAISPDGKKIALVADPIVSEDETDFEEYLSMFQDAPPAFTASEADSLVRVVVPLVEEFTQRKFIQLPPLVVGNLNATIESLEEDLMIQYEVLMATQPDSVREATATIQAFAMGQLMMGKYGLASKSLYLLPQNLTRLMQKASMDTTYTKEIALLIIAHELTHALQDQEIKLDNKLSTINRLDASTAFSAAIEGHAVVVQEWVGKKLGLNNAVLELARFFSAGTFKSDDAFTNLTQNRTASYFEQVYLGGRDFIQFHYDTEGTDAVWAILRNPPSSSSMIANPETYSAIYDEPAIDLVEIIKGMASYFGKNDWQVQHVELGAVQLNAVYAQMKATVRSQFVDNIQTMQSLVVSQENPKQIGTITIGMLKQPEMGMQMIGWVEEMAMSNLESLKENSMIEVKDVENQDYLNTHTSIGRSFTFSMDVLETTTKVQLFRFIKDKFYIEITDTNIGITKDAIDAILNTLIQRLPSDFK